MLLETLDLRIDDVLIYSQNMFNFNESFKIIFKNEKVKRPRRISYFDVCSYVKDPSPKNLIIYRLLTNVNNLDAYSTKYGYFIKINGKIELIYFDPIFAIKDLRHLRFDFDPQKFRFKIQQVGLTSLTKKENEPNFAEVYNFDLKAVEAQSQNDKIFADAIFAFDDSFIDEEFEAPDNLSGSVPKNFSHRKFPNGTGKESPEHETKIEAMMGINPDKEEASIKKIAEDTSFAKQSLTAPNPPEAANVKDLREEIITLLKQALGIEEITQPDSESVKELKAQTGIHQFTEEQKPELSQVYKRQTVNNLFDLFKTTNKSDELSARERDSVILKFD